MMLNKNFMCLGLMIGFLGYGAFAADQEKYVIDPDVNPHVCFVNVGKGIATDSFDTLVSNACSQIKVRWKCTGLPKVSVADVAVTRDQQEKRLGKGAIFAVYIVNDPNLPGLFNLPGQCSLINIRTMKADNPSDSVYRIRLTRMIMKGLGYATGVGGNHDPRCVMYWKSFSVKGIDGTSSTFGPFAFFAMQDILTEWGKDAIFRADR